MKSTPHDKTLYVSDMDGTLLGSDSRVSSTSIRLINDAIAQGALFTVATARTPATVVPLMNEINTNLPFICLNGAALWDNRLHNYTHVETVSEKTVQAIVGIYAKHGLTPFVYRRHENKILAYHVGDMSNQEKQFVAERQGLELKKFILEATDYRHSSDAAMLMFAMQDYDRLRPIYQEIKDKIDCSIVFYHDIFDHNSGILEIYAPGVSKAQAVQKLKQATGARRLVVFGDNRNDKPMMHEANHSVAVANAFDEVKAEADEVIESNTADAVARYIHVQQLGGRTM